MKIIKAVCSIHVMFLIFAMTGAQAHSDAKTTVIKSEILGQDRTIIIHLPDSYAHSKKSSYPVLYMLDGGSYDKLTDTTIKKNVRAKKMPETIVVAITNKDENNPDIDRTFDLSPTYTKMDEDRRFGNADNFYGYLKEEVITHVEKTYRTNGKRTMMGHSFGGLFVMHNMIRDPEYFNAY